MTPAAAAELVATIAPSLRGLLAGEGPLKVVTYDPAARAADYFESEAGRAAVKGGPLSPDQIVYAGSFPLLFDPPADAPAEAIPALLREESGAERGRARHGPDHHGRARPGHLRRRRHPEGSGPGAAHLPRRHARVAGRRRHRPRAGPERRRARLHRDLGGGGLPSQRGRLQPRPRPLRRTRRARHRRRPGLRPRDRPGARRRPADTSSWPTSTRRWPPSAPQELEAAHGTGRAWSVAMDVTRRGVGDAPPCAPRSSATAASTCSSRTPASCGRAR